MNPRARSWTHAGVISAFLWGFIVGAILLTANCAGGAP